MHPHLFLSFLLCLFIPAARTNAQAQVHFVKLTGIVLTQNGMPLENASVKLLRSNLSLHTRSDGKFGFVFPMRSDTLIVLHRNYLEQRIMINSVTKSLTVRLRAK